MRSAQGKPHRRKRQRAWLVLTLAAGVAFGIVAATPLAWGQESVGPGVSPTRILVGIEGTTGSFSVDEENLGFRLVVAEVNARGGIHGRTLEARGYPRGPALEDLLANVRSVLSVLSVPSVVRDQGEP